jgi:hypothetical protein
LTGSLHLPGLLGLLLGRDELEGTEAVTGLSTGRAVMGWGAVRSAGTGAIPVEAAESPGFIPAAAGTIGDASGDGVIAVIALPWRGDGAAILSWVTARPWLMIAVMPRAEPPASTKQTRTATVTERVWDGSGKAIAR